MDEAIKEKEFEVYEQVIKTSFSLSNLVWLLGFKCNKNSENSQEHKLEPQEVIIREINGC